MGYDIMVDGNIPATVGGIYQYIIGALLFVISTLSGAIIWQYKEAVSVNKARLTERDVLNKTLSDVNATLVTLSAASSRRNDVMDKFNELIMQVSVTLKMLTDRLDLQHAHTSKDLERSLEVVEALAESVRVVANEVRQGFNEVKNKLKV
jgi:hypothetical protein